MSIILVLSNCRNSQLLAYSQKTSCSRFKGEFILFLGCILKVPWPHLSRLAQTKRCFKNVQKGHSIIVCVSLILRPVKIAMWSNVDKSTVGLDTKVTKKVLKIS